MTKRAIVALVGAMSTCLCGGIAIGLLVGDLVVRSSQPEAALSTTAEDLLLLPGCEDPPLPGECRHRCGGTCSTNESGEITMCSGVDEKCMRPVIPDEGRGLIFGSELGSVFIDTECSQCQVWDHRKEKRLACLDLYREKVIPGSCEKTTKTKTLPW